MIISSYCVTFACETGITTRERDEEEIMKPPCPGKNL